MSLRREQQLAGLGDLEAPQVVTFSGPLACSQVIFQPETLLPKINALISAVASLHFSFRIPDSYLPTWADTRFGKFTQVLPGQRAPDLAPGQGDSLGGVSREGREFSPLCLCA